MKKNPNMLELVAKELNKTPEQVLEMARRQDQAEARKPGYRSPEEINASPEWKASQRIFAAAVQADRAR